MAHEKGQNERAELNRAKIFAPKKKGKIRGDKKGKKNLIFSFRCEKYLPEQNKKGQNILVSLFPFLVEYIRLNLPKTQIFLTKKGKNEGTKQEGKNFAHKKGQKIRGQKKGHENSDFAPCFSTKKIELRL